MTGVHFLAGASWIEHGLAMRGLLGDRARCSRMSPNERAELDVGKDAPSNHYDHADGWYDGADEEGRAI